VSDIGSGNVDMFSLQEINELYACDTSISLYMYDTSLKTKKKITCRWKKALNQKASKNSQNPDASTEVRTSSRSPKVMWTDPAIHGTCVLFQPRALSLDGQKGT
jgi:hypothetical protein